MNPFMISPTNLLSITQDDTVPSFGLSPVAARAIAQTAMPMFQGAQQAAVRQGFVTSGGDWQRYAMIAGVVIVGVMFLKRL